MSKSKKVPAKKSSKKIAKTVEPKGGRIALKTICGELGVDPKRARVKLRRALRREENPAVGFHSIGSRWDLSAAEAKEVRAILSA